MALRGALRGAHRRGRGDGYKEGGVAMQVDSLTSSRSGVVRTESHVDAKAVGEQSLSPP